VKGNQEDTKSLWLKEFMEKIGFEPGVRMWRAVDGASDDDIELACVE